MTKTIGFDFVYGAETPYSEQDDWQRRSHGYTITLRYERRTERFDYWQGEAITDDPTLSGVMYCLASDAQYGEYNFREFCDELGYDEDNRRAEQTWKACQRSTDKLRRLFGADFDEIVSREWED